MEKEHPTPQNGPHPSRLPPPTPTAFLEINPCCPGLSRESTPGTWTEKQQFSGIFISKLVMVGCPQGQTAKNALMEEREDVDPRGKHQLTGLSSPGPGLY